MSSSFRLPAPPLVPSIHEAFREFSSAELDVGYDYALKQCGVRLDRQTLKVVANRAGAIRKAKGGTPRVVTVESLRIYERNNHIDISHDRYEAYVRAVGKMLSERNPATRRKRVREEHEADIKAAS